MLCTRRVCFPSLWDVRTEAEVPTPQKPPTQNRKIAYAAKPRSNSRHQPITSDMPTFEDLSYFSKRLHERRADYKLPARLGIAGRKKSSDCWGMASVDDFLNLLITRTSTSFPCRLA